MPSPQLNARIETGEVTLKYEPVRGYLPAVLEALRPVADLADAGLLADQLPGVAHLAGQSAGDLLQRQRAVAFIRGAPLVEVAVAGSGCWARCSTSCRRPRARRRGCRAARPACRAICRGTPGPCPGPFVLSTFPRTSRSRLRQRRHRRFARAARPPLRRLVRDRRAGAASGTWGTCRWSARMPRRPSARRRRPPSPRSPTRGPVRDVKATT